jgi:uncharacterized protein YjiS (DUF1127 family)
MNVSTYAIRHPEAAVLHGFAVLLHAGARRVSLAAQKLDAWLEARRLAADARRDLSEMSDRELRDIGLDRADVGTVVKGGSPRSVEERIAAISFAASMRS